MPLSVKPTPATGHINPVFASKQALDDREAAFWEAKRQEEARRRKETQGSMRKKRVIMFMRQHSNQVYIVNLQTIKLVFQQFKADHELALYQRTPQGRWRVKKADVQKGFRRSSNGGLSDACEMWPSHSSRRSIATWRCKRVIQLGVVCERAMTKG